MKSSRFSFAQFIVVTSCFTMDGAESFFGSPSYISVGTTTKSRMFIWNGFSSPSTSNSLSKKRLLFWRLPICFMALSSPIKWRPFFSIKASISASAVWSISLPSSSPSPFSPLVIINGFTPPPEIGLPIARLMAFTILLGAYRLPSWAAPVSAVSPVRSISPSRAKR